MENFLRPKDFGFLYTTFFLLLAVLLPPSGVYAQDAAALLQKVRGRLDQVNDYQASGLMKTNVPFMKVPEAQVTVYFKKPDKLSIKNKNGTYLVPNAPSPLRLNNLLNIHNNTL